MPYTYFFKSELPCEAIQVTDDIDLSETTHGGLYFPSDKRASGAPQTLVWKKSGGNRFIFNSGTTDGWMIGDEESLTAGDYYCKGKHILIIFNANPKRSTSFEF